MGVGIDWLRGLVVEGPFPPARASAYRVVLIVAILVSTGIAILDTVPDLWGAYDATRRVVLHLTLALLLLDYALRLSVAWEAGRWQAVMRYATSVFGAFDLLAVLPFLVAEVLDLPRDSATIFGIIRFFKLARYSPALETLGAVISAQFRPLASSLFIMMLLIISTSTLLYFVERADNPSFASVPAAMWWSVVTLATLGYGDAVPITALGKVLGGGVAILGLCMFALPASILASGFNEEMRRQNFVSTWHLVAKVPFFSSLQASQIAEIASVLKVYRAVRGEVLMRAGDLGETMYFLVSGQVEVRREDKASMLEAGDFFGEIALLEQCPRTATVKTLTRCQLLILDARDFHKVVATYPHLMDAIRETARIRLGKVGPS